MFLQKEKDILLDVLFFLEVPARFELANNGFADRGLTTWLRYHIGAGDEARTRYLHLGKVALYRMSYTRILVLTVGTKTRRFRGLCTLMVPPVGIEPTTRGFSVHCSTN